MSIRRNASSDFSDSVLDDLADRLMPLILDLLRERVHPEALGLAEAAAEVPFLDEVCLNVLADWLEERQMPGIGWRVRKLALAGGDLLVLQLQRKVTPAAWDRIREDAKALEERLYSRGLNVCIVVLQDGMTLQHVIARGEQS